MTDPTAHGVLLYHRGISGFSIGAGSCAGCVQKRKVDDAKLQEQSYDDARDRSKCCPKEDDGMCILQIVTVYLLLAKPDRGTQ